MFKKYDNVAAFELSPEEYEECYDLLVNRIMRRELMCPEDFEILDKIPTILHVRCPSCKKEWKLVTIMDSEKVNGYRQLPDGLIEVFAWKM